MRFPVAMMVAAALVLTACAEPPAEDIVERDTPADAMSPPAGMDVPPPAPSPDAAEEADAATAASDDPASETDGDVATAIPARFRGEWNADRAACGTGQSETRLRVSGDRIRFYESVGVVRGIEIESDRVITVTARYQGEGDTWQDERRLSLSDDGNSLTVSGGGDLVRYRCP